MVKTTKKAIAARVNRAAWDWLEMQGINKNKLLDKLLTQYVHFLQHNDRALKLLIYDDNDPNFNISPLTLYQQYEQHTTP